MITIQDKQAYADLSIIIKMMPKCMSDKISNNFIKLIEENKDNEYISNIKPYVPIREQELSETTKALLALIYRDFLCNEEERKKLIIKEKQEIKKIEKANRKKYEIKFESQKNIIQNSSENKDNESLLDYKKENVLTKLLNKIKKILKKGKEA